MTAMNYCIVLKCLLEIVKNKTIYLFILLELYSSLYWLHLSGPHYKINSLPIQSLLF